MKIVAASCIKYRQINPQPVWKSVQKEQVDALVLLGDTVYLEHDSHQSPAALGGELDKLYLEQLNEPNFKALLADLSHREKPVLAIYDDHDFLGNNRYGGDNDPKLCIAARDAFIKAFRPLQTGADVYSSRVLGPAQFVVLDERFHRRSPSNGGDAVLGSRQWEWLENVVAASQSPFLVIVSSTTFHQFGDESWEQYPGAFRRLRDLLKDRRGAFILSGDVHRNALYDDSGVIEVVTSAIARKGLVFGATRENYAVLTFSEDRVRIELRSLKAGWRFDVTLHLVDWRIP